LDNVVDVTTRFQGVILRRLNPADKAVVIGSDN
jgi:hypothetical protein